jgi:prolyl oligopeptidase
MKYLTHPVITTAACILALVTGVAMTPAQAQGAAKADAPPIFKPGATTDNFFGTVVADPYRELEDIKAPAVASWMKAQAEHAQRVLGSLGLRERLLADIQKYDDAVAARVAAVQRTPDGRWFFQKRGAQDNQFKLYVREKDGQERLLVDPEAISRADAKAAKRRKPVPHAINWYLPSPDGKVLAYGLSAGGSESATLHVVDVATRRPLGGPVPRADYGVTSWAPDGRSLYVIQLAAMKPGMSALQKYQNSRVMRLPLGGTAGSLKPVLGPGTPGVKIAPEETPALSLTADGRWALAVVINGVQRELRAYAAEASAFHAGRPQWRQLFDRDAGIVEMNYAQGTLYAITHQGAPRFKLIAGAVQGFDAAKAHTLVAPGERVLTGLAAAADALYVEQREGNVKRLSKRTHLVDGAGDVAAPLTPIALPFDGAFTLMGGEGSPGAGDERIPGVILDLQGWTRARQIYEVTADGRVVNTGLQPAGPYDAPEHIVATELTCTSHDGAKVPMSVIHKKGIPLDGNQPTLLYGYASYGFTEEPRFNTGRLAWINAGGVFAIANPRGSGVLGQDWYKAGFQATKPNTWKDFIACAEALIAQKFTSPAKLGILGGSAGGILVGRAMTDRPDLFAAVIPAVGALDAIRWEVTPNGLVNVPEFGSRATEAGFRALLEMSTLHQIKDGVNYPAVLLTHGVNDPRVDVWESTKTAARLLAASRSGKPVLLRLDYDAGHGIGNTKAQQQAERADMYAFLLWQMGVAGAGPR